jgi:hypothetical protein
LCYLATIFFVRSIVGMVLLLKNTLKCFYFITKIFVLFDFILFWIMVLIIVLIDLTNGLET